MQIRSLRRELTILICFAVLPMLAFGAAVVFWGAWLHERSFESGVQNTTAALSLAVNREVDTWRATLNAVAVLPSIDSGDFLDLQRRTQPLAATYGGWFVLFALDGTPLMSTAVPYGTPLQRSPSASSLEKVIRTRDSQLSDLFATTMPDGMAVAIYVPVLRAGKVKYVLGMGVRPDRLSRLLAIQPLPTDWFSSLVGRDNRVVARSLNAEKFVGGPASTWFKARKGDRGLLHGSSLEGQDVLVAFQEVEAGAWTVSVAVPRTVAARDLWTALAALLMGGTVLLALAVWMSGRVAARVGAPVFALARAAESNSDEPVAETSRIIELQQLERALRQAKATERERAVEREKRLALEASNHAKDEFLATLSHELRTPLQAALGWLHVLQLAGEDRATAQRALPVVERNLRQLGQLVDDLIDASRIVSGKLSLKFEPLDLAPLLRQTLETWQPAVETKEQELEAQVQEPVWVMADRARLSQVFSNLVANAVKFTPQSGRIEVQLVSDGETAKVSIRDSGEGMLPEVLREVFTKFWQAQTGSARTHQGLGLGLAIVKSLVELHHGEVSAASDGVGHGSSFMISLPLTPDRPTISLAADAPPEAALAGRRVLLVDDDGDAGSAVARLLEMQGARVTFAQSVDAAELALAGERFDLVLSDIAMPARDGFEMLRVVRARADGESLPVFALTAFASDLDRQRVLQAGFDGFLSKPVDAETLVHKLACAKRVG